MANTFSVYCREYVNNQEALLNMLNTYSLTQDLVKPLLAHRGKFISYDQVTLGSNSMGDFNRATGYQALDITSTRVERELTQDKGDKLAIDLMDQEEAQIEGGVVRLYNRYIVKNAIPSIDAYRFGKIADLDAPSTAHASITSSNIVGFLMNDKAILENKRVKWAECIVYMAVSEKAKLDEAAFGKSLIAQGSWNGSIDSFPLLFGGAKIVAVPDGTLGTGIAWLIVHPLAVEAFIVYQEAQFFDRIPGFGGRRGEVDVGMYHDCWISPNGGFDGVVVAYNTTPKVALPDDFTFASASGTIKVTGVVKGAKVYYGTSSGSATTELEASGGEFLLPSVSATTTYYVVQKVNGVASAENSVTATKE